MKIYKQCVSMHKYLNPPSKANRALASEWQLFKTMGLYIHGCAQTMVTRKVRSTFLPFLWKCVRSEFEMDLCVSKLQLLFRIYHLAHRWMVFSFIFCWNLINLSQLTAWRRQCHNDDNTVSTPCQVSDNLEDESSMMPNNQVAKLPNHWPRLQMTAWRWVDDGWGGRWKVVATTKTGPNDASGVIWAIDMFFI